MTRTKESATCAVLATGLFARAAHGLEFDVAQQPLELVATEAIGAAIFYAANLAAMALLMVTALFIRQVVWAFYTLLVILGLVYIGLFEQNLTGVIWTGLDVSEAALLIFGYLMFSINFVVAGLAIPVQHRFARFKAYYLWAAGGVWVIWLMGQPFSGQFRYVLFAVAGCGVACGHYFPVSTFSKWQGGTDVLARNAIWLLLSFTLFAATFAVLTASTGLTANIATINRTIIALIAACFAFLFIRHMFVLRSERELAMQTALKSAEENVRTGQALLAARKQYDEVQELARMRNMRLASASHDIRQPITALRTSFAAMAAHQPPEMRQHLHTSLDYLDQLAASYIDEAHQQEVRPEDPRVERKDQGSAVSMGLVAQTLDKMFRDEALDRGLSLRVDVSAVDLRVDALALMRILSNLVTNAVKHAQAGEIVVEGAQTSAGFVWSVTNNTQGTLDFDDWSKGDASGGSGLGLSIVTQQAKEAGLRLNLTHTAQDRVTVAVEIPHAAGATAW